MQNTTEITLNKSMFDVMNPHTLSLQDLQLATYKITKGNQSTLSIIVFISMSTALIILIQGD